jgi:uncharacterized protein YndB with AHSA1/START domain
VRQFTCATNADPAVVWAALTEPDLTRRYLYGLAAHSCWKTDAPIEFRHESLVLQGHVMRVDPNCRLSYCLSAGPDDPTTYLTWQIRTCPVGSTIRLQIDETNPFEPGAPEDEEDMEDIWLPVLAALQLLLAENGFGA